MSDSSCTKLLAQFRAELDPLEQDAALILLTDNRTGAQYSECHVRAEKLIECGTPDVPLDPEQQSEYRANRTLTDDAAFLQMQSDALGGRSFSNLVAEYIPGEKPLKIIGGQHRFAAIGKALDASVNEYHGVKVYFGLDKTQRLDVQLISNTNIVVSGALCRSLARDVSWPELAKLVPRSGPLEARSGFR